ncbi:Phospholipase A2 domain-containing protein [Strongyloides ratti]|uniref:Phospholipase A2 domain-containing protein n=1 Tax=Strongyloides ratti TaxID=34506 RepID=A0A090MWF7_STRRB|nr:Phospholipase A2 domain-containing protein [Strongyloides ratti]CEF63684.1 Phospholipase A2 domain-containing protein [Strongyloides ratti]
MADDKIITQKVLLEEHGALCNVDTICDSLLKQLFELYNSKNIERFKEGILSLQNLIEKRETGRYEELEFKQGVLENIKSKNDELEIEVQNLKKELKLKNSKYVGVTFSKEEEESISLLIEELRKIKTKKELEMDLRKVFEAISFYEGETKRLEKETASFDKSITAIMDVIGKYDKCVIRTADYLECVATKSDTEQQTGFLSLKGAELSCTKNQYLKINDCCRIHDSCYGNKILLQTQCDSFLEKCFEEATSVEVGIKKFTCKALIITFELAVEMFGSRAFNKTK